MAVKSEKERREKAASQTAEEETLEKVYSAINLPFDRRAYRAISQKAQRRRSRRALLGLLTTVAVVAAAVLFIVLFVHSYAVNVIISQPETVQPSVKGPKAGEAYVKEDLVVIRLEQGDNELELDRTSVLRKETGEAVPVTCDREEGTVSFPYPGEDAVFIITVYDGEGNDFTLTAKVGTGKEKQLANLPIE